jgi:2-methylisocitrate lyase-like PEP mutase family enzyme
MTTPPRPSLGDKRRAFRQLHEQGCFLIPNPWDVGSARWLQGLGFRALASTSSGFAWSQGHADNQVSRDQMLDHLRTLVEASDLPINADFERAYVDAADDLAGVAANVRLAADTGVAGLSLEDSTGRSDRPLFSVDEAAARLRAARQAIDHSGADVMLVGRAECFLVGRPDLEETITRLRAYADAGADCLYAPGIRTREQIVAVVQAVAPRPVNLLVGSTAEFTLADIAAMGVRRVSVGGALARAAWGGFQRAAALLASEGRFDGFKDAASGQALNDYFTQDLAGRSTT